MHRRLLIAGMLVFELASLSAANVSRAAPMNGLSTAPPFLGFVTSDPGGNIWFAERSGVARLDVRGRFTHFSLPQSDFGRDLAASADGSVWFTQTGSAGRISTDGIVHEYPIDEPNAKVIAITAGPDDAMWFVAQSGSRPVAAWVGRITALGKVTTYRIPQLGLPGDITLGPDGNLWFTYTTYIGRCSPAGHITLFAIPQSSDLLRATTYAERITVGPDHNLWFTQFDGSIARISVKGVIARFRVSDIVPMWDIVAGPGRQVWFTMWYDSRVGRMDMHGKVAYTVLPTEYSGPWGATTAPDGSVWLTATCINTLVRIGRDGKITEYPVDGRRYPARGYCIAPV